MNKYRFVRLFILFSFISGFLYSYINKQNDLTKLHLTITNLWQRLRETEQRNSSLEFIVHKLESPEHLMEIAALPEFSYLVFPEENSTKVLE